MSKLTFGIGYKSIGEHKATINGKHTPAYARWCSMLKRCYDPKYHESHPTYIGCTVDEQWHDFQRFASWFYAHEFSDKGYQLDKDLLIPGNKIYSADSCCFVPSQLNSLFIDDCSRRGRYPRGVSFEKDRGGFKVSIRIDGKDRNLGRFKDPEEAHQVYKRAKEANVKRMALEWQDRIADNVFQALMTWQLIN